MSSLSGLFHADYNTQREQWEKQLLSELKLTDLKGRTTKKSLENGIWPTLSLESLKSVQIPVSVEWKKAAQTYVLLSDKISEELKEDLEGGTRLFFFDKKFLSESLWKKISQTLLAFQDHKDVQIILLGSGLMAWPTAGLNVLDESQMLVAREVYEEGGSHIQELALIGAKFIEALENSQEATFGLFLDSHFFKNIAKIRALKLMARKILSEVGLEKKIHVVALTSLREWTLYERYSNMLRNDASVASAYIGGADYVQSCGYQILFHYESGKLDPEQDERSRRMARNTSHILALESMLGIVQDAAFGSYHLENLTQYYAQEAWKLMQQLLPLKGESRLTFLSDQVKSVRESRLELVKTRRHVLAGMNDFPNAKESLGMEKTKGSFFRVARGFEELRFKMEALKTKPTVGIALFGDYAALSARINFVKNYFELLGLEVHDPSKGMHDTEAFKKDLHSRKENIIVLCASDENYLLLKDELQGLKTSDKFVAGKVDWPGFQSLHVGQDVFKVLESIVSRWSHP